MPNQDTSITRAGPTLRFLTFRLDDRLYALPASDVAEVIRIPAVARMPQSPRGLLGLANLRGVVLPVASGRGLLGQKNESDVVHGRAIVLNDAAPVAIAVDAVTALIEIEMAAIETRETELAALQGEALNGAFQPDTGGPVVKVLDVKSLLKTAFIARERSHRKALRGVQASSSLTTESSHTSADKFLAFAVAGQDYALPLAIIQEIVAAPAILADVPHSETLVLGVASHRDALLPLLSLRGLLGFGPNPETSREKVVIANVRGSLVGLVVDEMRAIFAGEQSRIDPIPDVLAARTGGESRIASIFRADNGGNLISILSPEQLFGDDVMQKLTDAHRQAQPSDGPQMQTGETQQFLVFTLGDEEFGLPIGAVEEVARVPDKIARVPNTPRFLEGVINLRGEVIPVVDQRKRFGIPSLTESTSRRLIVVRTERHIAGLVVDSVSEVLRAAVDQIDVAPDLTGESTRLVSGVFNLESQNRIILLLDPAELLTRTERGLLDKFAKQRNAPERTET